MHGKTGKIKRQSVVRVAVVLDMLAKYIDSLNYQCLGCKIVSAVHFVPVDEHPNRTEVVFAVV
jgi:hypothetical protein